MRTCRLPTRSAFTLMELTVVMAILGVIAVAATSMLGGRRVVTTLEAKQTAGLLVASCRLARTTAILQGQPIYLVADAEGYGLRDHTGQPLQPKHFYAPDLQATWSAASVAFQPTGMTDRSLQIRLQNGLKEWRIDVLSGSGQAILTETWL